MLPHSYTNVKRIMLELGENSLQNLFEIVFEWKKLRNKPQSQLPRPFFQKGCRADPAGPAGRQAGGRQAAGRCHPERLNHPPTSLI
jgi:hypothetical protein